VLAIHASSRERRHTVRTVVIAVVAVVAAAVGALVGALAASGGSSASSASEQALQRGADLWAINQIEKSFHKATSRKNIDLMMSLWAPNATLTAGPGQTAAGTKQIRRFWLTKASVFKPENKWLSDTPAYKVRITVNGDRGTLSFECHYLDLKTGRALTITRADQEVARIEGKWLITSMVGGSAPLRP
jgi:ketosteroid isomerase-like protein